jgi:dTDP-4-amino-4,6-dideoxygalactose transaminase
LTTGEGGLLVTDDAGLAQRLRRLRNHGIERTDSGAQFVEAGFNYRLTDFQAALGRAQLPHLAAWIEARRALAGAYRAALQPLAQVGRLALPTDHAGHSWQTFMIVLADDIDRARVIGALAERGIEANLGAQCISAQPAFAAFASRSRRTAQQLYQQGLALPFCELYGSSEVRRVVEALVAVLGAGHG